ncbi:hypothetical protein [Halofilum ochraceum]|uniref:hypothetical protein n=1 Tax=Halofilum ochraceum TaxID=1611323 RepID=UPI0008DAE266|nr:hypothetical protein [Halofilum ochraceum]
MKAADSELPRYRSHKEVRAVQIEKVIPTAGGGAEIVPVDAGISPFTVEAAYMKKHKPEAGGYYVVYSDGYESWSPKEAFEQGYTRIK